jgi:hypothetical protein
MYIAKRTAAGALIVIEVVILSGDVPEQDLQVNERIDCDAASADLPFR